MKTSEFDYDLPESFIAQTPIEPRDSSRLMVVNRRKGTITHRIFRDIGDYVQPGDLLIANQSRVIPARLFARKVPGGGKVELLLLARRDALTWESLVKGRKTPVGTELVLTDPQQKGRPVAQGKILAWTESGGRLIRWDHPIDPYLEDLGIVPLPPYIHTPLADPERYQTVYARQPGSVAAPTAGLHFTPELLLSLRERGIELAFVTLDIGLDTFRPVETERVEDHHIHTEHCSLSADVARQINRAKLEGRRIVAVGTTSVRVLETAAELAAGRGDGGGESPGTGCERRCGWQAVQAFEGPTDLFIYPGFVFRVVDVLLTNFHLPRSSLLMLVSAFAGRELMLEAYQEAINEAYRFFSFGDVMLIV
ncbi:MAG: tRNA preQ1(34) S-adenosylmethionine ribosyltransferase-isomerase QueA [Anaerolineae bacterium]|nr:tRNA preQ1(34) S-adenosylmethionine ribosyltransferase-isomerase QueA [Anaerolineae bacterium]